MGRTGGRWKRPPSAFSRKIKRYERILNRELQNALPIAVEAVRYRAKGNAYPTRRVSESDSDTGRKRTFSGRTPIRRRIQKSQNRGQIYVQPYYTGARTKAIISLFTAFGRRKELTREGLFVYRPWVKLSKLVFVKYSEDRNLKLWAIKRKMIQKHKVRVKDPRILQALLLTPAMRDSQSDLEKIYRSAFLLAGARF